MKKEIMKKNNKGFSLVELIVVIAIMAVLMVVLAPAMLRYVEKTRVQKDESAVSEVANAAELAMADETVYAKAGGADYVIVTVADNGDIKATTNNSAAAGTTAFAELEKDVKATVGDKIDFASKAHNSQTATIVLHYDSTRQAYVLYTESGATSSDGHFFNGVKWPSSTPTT